MSRFRPLPLVLLLACVALGLAAFLKSRRSALVVYCAHDAIYAEAILDDFSRKTGIPVAVRFDTEATKSLGLTELIFAEAAAPRCDVFWNNELLGMMDLRERGLLQPYTGPGFARIPSTAKDPAGHWAGFGARMRVWIYNSEKLATSFAESEIARRCGAGDLSRVAIAKPLYGTTLTHYSVLWQQMGAEKLQEWHRDWRRRGVREVNGNAAVKDLVASGACDFGLADSDDFFEALDEGLPVAALPVRVEGGKSICIPNSIAIIRGSKRQVQAQRLVDFMLSEETEIALARSKSRQIPVAPVGTGRLPKQVSEWSALAGESVPLLKLSAARKACLAWLKQEGGE